MLASGRQVLVGVDVPTISSGVSVIMMQYCGRSGDKTRLMGKVSLEPFEEQYLTNSKSTNESFRITTLARPYWIPFGP